MQALRQTSNAIAERRTFALSMARALPIVYVVYKATVTTSPGDARVYTGMTEQQPQGFLQAPQALA